MNIGAIAKQAKIEPSTIRYYESIGLLQAPARQNGRRVYDSSVLERLQLIALAKKVGFTLQEIKALLMLDTQSGHISQQWRAAAQMKLTELDSVISQAEAMKALIYAGLACDCDSIITCELNPVLA